MPKPTVIPMFSEVSSPEISNVFVNNNRSLCTMQITGTYTTATLKIQGQVDTGSSEWGDIAVFDLSNLDLDSKAQGNGIYQAAIEGVLRVRFNLTAITGGSLTAVANFI